MSRRSIDSAPRSPWRVAAGVMSMIYAAEFEGVNRRRKTRSASQLTPREREILQLLVEGRKNRDVGKVLNISVKTAETHRANIMLKMNFHSVTELVRYAVKNKIIQP